MSPAESIGINKSIKYIAAALVFIGGTFGGNALYQWVINQPGDNAKSNTTTHQMISSQRPDFSLPDIDGEIHHINEWDGKIVLVNFWATWCPPCQREMPALIELQETYADQGLHIVGVAIDTPDKVKDFMDTMGVNYTSLIGEDEAVKISRAYGNKFGALPYSVLIDRQGKIRFIKRGELTKEVAEKNINPLL